MNIIIVFPNIENGRKIKSILQQNGFEVKAVCTTGAMALQAALALSEGIVICGYRLGDMIYSELCEDLPDGFEMLLMASAALCDGRQRQEILCLKMPLQVHELLRTVEMMSMALAKKRRLKKGPKERTKEEIKILSKAKGILMEQNHMTEEEAHRYLQKRSMENRIGLIEMAQVVLSSYGMV